MSLPTLAPHRFVVTLTLATAALACETGHAPDEHTYVGKARDAWLHGKLETALRSSPQLGRFEIRRSVSDGRAELRGSVASAADRDLASAIAESIEGVTDVGIELSIEPSGGVLRARAAHLLCEIVSDTRVVGQAGTAF